MADENDGDDATWGLVLPFLTDDPQFAYGVEVGRLYERMKAEDEINGVFLTANQEQITLMVNRLGWVIDEMEIQGDDFALVMHKGET